MTLRGKKLNGQITLVSKGFFSSSFFNVLLHFFCGNYENIFKEYFGIKVYKKASNACHWGPIFVTFHKN